MDGSHPTTAGYRCQSPDTDEWAERMLFEHWSGLGSADKAAIVSDLCAAAHRLCLAGLALRHPDAGEDELELRAACLRLGRDQVEAALGRPLPFPA